MLTTKKIGAAELRLGFDRKWLIFGLIHFYSGFFHFFIILRQLFYFLRKIFGLVLILYDIKVINNYYLLNCIFYRYKKAVIVISYIFRKSIKINLAWSTSQLDKRSKKKKYWRLQTKKPGVGVKRLLRFTDNHFNRCAKLCQLNTFELLFYVRRDFRYKIQEEDFFPIVYRFQQAGIFYYSSKKELIFYKERLKSERFKYKDYIKIVRRINFLSKMRDGKHAIFMVPTKRVKKNNYKSKQAGLFYPSPEKELIFHRERLKSERFKYQDYIKIIRRINFLSKMRAGKHAILMVPTKPGEKKNYKSNASNFIDSNEILIAKNRQGSFVIKKKLKKDYSKKI